MGIMGEKRLVVFNVTVEVDPEAYAEEYGDVFARAQTPEDAADHVAQILKARMTESVTVHGITVPSFADNNGHWAKVHVSDHELLPVHRDGLRTGERNPYDSGRGLFKALCVCGEEFWGADPDDAEFKLSEHCEKENAG